MARVRVEAQDLTLVQMGLRALAVFFAALIVLRFAHKRFFARRNAIDVLLTFILASTLARAINGGAAFFPTLAAGALLILLHRALTFAAARYPGLGRLAKGSPVTLIEQGRINDTTCRERALSQADLEEDLRISGLSSPDRVERAVLERNGEISVIRAPRVQTIEVAGGVQHVRIEFA